MDLEKVMSHKEVIVEKIKKVSLETVKHLAQNTQNIQDLDKNGDVVPKKLLNVQKEDTIDLYENRFIYTLVKRLEDFIGRQLENIELIDRYAAYQILDDNWSSIATDLEMIQTEGFECTKIVDPHMEIKKEGDEEIEVQKGWEGHIIPFELIYQTKLQEETKAIKTLEDRLSEIASGKEEIFESLSEEDKSSSVVNDDGDDFVAKEVEKALKEAYAAVKSDEINDLRKYIELLDSKAKKPEKLAFIAEHTEADWSKMEAAKDGTYSKGNVNKYLAALQAEYQFEEDTLENILDKKASGVNSSLSNTITD